MLVEKFTSKNGVRIVLENIPTVRSVTIGIWILTGSRNENEKNNGISHFIEHLFFKGTKKRSAQEIAEAFDAIGGQINAFTSKEYTCFYAKVLDTHKEKALDILADMFFHSVFDEEEMNREKKVVIEEIKMSEDTPDDIVHDLLAQASYGNHPLGYPILGTEENLNRFTREEVISYIEDQYHPENVVISIAGNVDSAFIDRVDDYFGSYETKKQETVKSSPVFLSEEIMRNKDIEQAHLCLGYNGLGVDDPNIYSLLVMNNVLGGSMSSRLFQEVREKQGLAYSVFSYHSSFLDSGMLTIYAGTAKEQLNVLRETIHAITYDLAQHGLTEKELENSKEHLKGNLMLGLEGTGSRMSRNGRNELLLKRHRSLDEIIRQIDAVDHDSVNKVIQNLFHSSPAVSIITPPMV